MGLFPVIFWGLVLLSDVICILHILQDEADADARMVWGLIVLLLPVAGLVLYLVAGQHYRSEHIRRELHSPGEDLLRGQIPPELFPDGAQEQLEEAYRPLARLLRACGEGNRVFPGNSFEIITSGARKRELLLQDLQAARHFIHIEYFKFGADKAGREVREILMQKAAQGVQVRLLRNNMINWEIPEKYFKEMEAAGVEIVKYTHIRLGFRKWLMRLNAQNHRKIVIIDGLVAYTGGMNINDNYFYKWRDTHLRIQGPVISRLEASYLDSWFSCGGTLKESIPGYFPAQIPQGSGPYRDKTLQVVTDAIEYPWPTTQLGYEWILNNAREYVYIQTPYFVPPPSLLNALKGAALRGVDVRLMLPRKVDTVFLGPANRSCYAECLEAGVRLFVRSGEFIHSKTLVADDYVTIIGASNLDMRSFQVNSEVNTFVYDRETALSAKEIFLSDAQVEELHYEEWRRSQRFPDRLRQGWHRMCYRVL